jgi:lipopolysaccharide/colanic/teichoic acid biosynthesis glycosyltransferase
MHSTLESTYSGAIDSVTSAIAANETIVAAYVNRKKWFLRPIGAVLLLCSLPILLPLMLLVRLTSRGPAIYCQRRTGKDGREFVLYKLRTMYDGAEDFTGPIWTRPNDTRITPLGNVLRLLHLDELPQLFNVACGEMDLVGPRPERPEIVKDLMRVVPGYAERTKVLPGITGLAQINLPPDTTYDCVKRKLVLDREYISSASFGLDVRMILCTGLRLIGVRNGRAVRWLRLERAVSAEATGGAHAPLAVNGKAGGPPETLRAFRENGRGHDVARTRSAQYSYAGREQIGVSAVAAEPPRASVESRLEEQELVGRPKPR